ncbi:hypothetical protein GGI04_002886 [Coemansia thaxteri]|uniref:Tetratricopeptide repeat protein 36 n=1 Tax=Coemansia thaxteri TaxID=2663907 RepID=A0A9W8EGU1_9FUNG|nr:hypothetical protein GGI04_002886 [Coemansia thaxteri]KAJ2006165.1 hypothetical protein H4R26_001539 [Coemansia thaxteri]KAJ2471565.1 hypothetical protein GGI02_002180 [Coemansia sp. RSA 2322]KAJ2485724.1 hypothetical protein EV174_001550 [Coemansia sp. RSA 2320]
MTSHPDTSNASLAAGPSAHDSNLVDILFSSALDGEYVRDQISGAYSAYSPQQQETPATGDDKGQVLISESQLADLQARERNAILAAEQDGDVKAAIAQLTQIIEEYPSYASAYNNRAQALRLDGADLSAVLSDLDSAIRHAQDDKTRGQAYTQKGIVLKAQGGDQDDVFDCFAQGARCGNEVARMAMEKENPYAKLCGKIVSEAMRQLRSAPSPRS